MGLQREMEPARYERLNHGLNRRKVCVSVARRDGLRGVAA